MADATHKLLRAPLTVAARLPRGIARIAHRAGRWLSDADTAPVLARARREEKSAEAEKVRAARAARIQSRVGLLLAGCCAAGLVHLWLWPGVWQTGLAMLVVAALIDGGKPRPAGESAATVVKDNGEQAEITPGSIVAAFTAAMPAVKRALESDSKSLVLLGPVHRDGPGWAATVELPHGVTIEDCVRARERLASGLRVALDQMYLSPGRHAGQCRMWVARVPPSELPPVEWPYANSQRVSLVDPVPIGDTAKGTPVSLSLRTQGAGGRIIAGGSMLVGGVSGSGKTTLMRLIVSAAVLDPSATIAIFDGKGDADYAAFAPACDWYRVGASPDSLADLHAMLAEAQAEMERRQKGLSPRTPLLIVIDEVQRVKDKETLALIEDLLRTGRSSGIFLLIATQKASAETLPTDLRDSVRTRMCLKVTTQAANDMILGTGAYTEGRDATKLTRGMGLLLDVDTDTVDVVRVAYVTEEMAERIAANNPRPQGVMFGAGPVPAGPPVVPLISRIFEVWPGDADRASCAELAVKLAAEGGDFWGWEAADVTRELKAVGVETRVAKVSGRAVKAVFRDDLVQAWAPSTPQLS